MLVTLKSHFQRRENSQVAWRRAGLLKLRFPQRAAMSEPTHQELFELASRIDEVCGRFESAWQAGERPRMEDYLQDVVESERGDLLRDLLATELELLTKDGSFGEESSYGRRFPQFVDIIREVFAESAGHAIFGKLRDYELQQKLGEGSMGVVYKALHTRLKRSVAIKTLPPSSLHRPESISRFHREMEAIGQLDDPHIVRAHDAGEVDGTHYLVMEYVDGLDLRQLQERVGPLSVANACEIIRQAALGLRSATKVGLVHRDIKPSNLMLTRSGTVKLLDLGLAHLAADAETGQKSELTSTGQVMGTFDYLAPEQATDTRNIDVRADIYGLGCTLFKLLTGRTPYAGDRGLTAYQRIRAHIEEPIPSAMAIRTDIPAELDALLTKMLAKSPAERIQTPEELQQQITPLCAGHDLAALSLAAEGDAKAEADTAGASGETITFSSGVVPARASELKESDLPQHEPSPSPDVSVVAPSVGRTPRPSALSRIDGRGVRPTLVAAIALTLLSIAIAYFSGLIFKVQTPGGTIVLQCDPAALQDATIEIDGEQVRLQLTGDDQPITIGVDQRRGQLKITKAGFKVFDTNFEIAVGNNEQAIAVRLEPLPHAPGSVDAAAGWKPGLAENVLPGLIPRPATFPGIRCWQVETKLPRTIISAVAYSPDGRLIACGSIDGHVRIYDAESMELVDLFTKHTHAILSVAWSPDNQWLACAGGKDWIHLWHVVDRRWTSLAWEGAEDADKVTSVSWAADSTRFAVASLRAIDIFSLTGRKLKSLPAHVVRVVAWSLDGDTLAGGDANGKVQLWDTNDFTRGPVVESPAEVRCISWSPDSQQFATGDTAGNIQLWHRDGTPARSLESASNYASNSLAWSPRGNKLVSSGVRIKVHNLDDDSKSVISPPSYDHGNIRDLSWHPDGTRFASVDDQRSIGFWDSDGTPLEATVGNHGTAKQVSWCHDGQLLASSNDGNQQVRLWARNGTAQTVVKGRAPFAWHPHELHIATYKNDGSFQQWDGHGKHVGTIVPARAFGSWSAAWSPDGERFAVGHSDNGIIEVWEPGIKRLAELKSELAQQIGSIDWNSDSRSLASTSQGILQIWNADRVSPLKTKLAGTGYCVAWNAAGDRIAASGSNTLIVTPDGTKVGELIGLHYGVDWSPDGSRLVTANHDGSVNLWSSQAFPQGTLKSHDDIVDAVAWNPTGSLVASGSRDSTVIVWDAETQQAVWVGVQLGTGDSATFSVAGEVLDGTADVVEEHFVYIVENEDGSRELLHHSEFLKRTSSVVAGDANRVAAEWVLASGGQVDITTEDGRRLQLPRDGELPVGDFKVRAIAIENSPTDWPEEHPIHDLTSLEWLLLSNVRIRDAHVRQLTNLPALREISFHAPGNLLTDASLEHLQTFPQIESVGCVVFSDAGVQSLSTLATMKVLHLTAFTDVTSATLAPLQRLENLEQFRIDGGGTITWQTLSDLSELPKLRRLTVNLSPSLAADADGIRELNAFKRLSALALLRLPFSDPALKSLPVLERLEELDITLCSLTDEAAEKLSEFIALRLLRLWGNAGISDRSLIQIAELSQLTELDLTGTSVTASGVAELSRSLPKCRIIYGPKAKPVVIEPK